VPERCYPAAKRGGHVRFLFISRISRIKNLHGALQLLSQLDGEIEFDIYGPKDEDYWRECEKLIPKNVSVSYSGCLAPEEVLPAFQRGHFFLFPTEGENFGHVIFESLAAGCPPITTTDTPWRGINIVEAGFCFPFVRPLWLTILQSCVDMGGDEYRDMALNAHRYAQEWHAQQRFIEAHSEMLIKACGNGVGHAGARGKLPTGLRTSPNARPQITE
jgi:glycosyltransferase involved in cell wall biosynthesis